jgi:ABC-type phosphate transport system substrate-binding protein
LTQLFSEEEVVPVKIVRSTILLALALGSAAPCFAHHMAVVVSKQNAVSAMTSAQLSKILLAETKSWPDGKAINVVLHRASAGEGVTLQRLNKMSAQQWQAWIRDHKDSIKLVDSDSDVLSYVASTPGAIGLVELHSVNDRVTVVRIDGKVPLEEGYLPH